MESRKLRKHLNEVLIKGKKSERLAIFDLDDTLIISSAKIKVLNPKTGSTIIELTPEEFNHYTHDPKNTLSFDEFEDAEILRKSSFITDVVNKLLDFYRRGVHVSIVTARSKSQLIRDFFLENKIDIHPDLVIAVNDPKYGFKGSIAERKKEAIHRLVDSGYKDLIFFDDNQENLELAKEIEGEKDVRIQTIKVG